MGPPMIELEKVIDFHTFSITARDREAGAFGVAVTTARPNVGSLVPWVSVRGAIATQARVNTDLGRQGQALLAHVLQPARRRPRRAGRRASTHLAGGGRPLEADRSGVRPRRGPALRPGQALRRIAMVRSIP